MVHIGYDEIQERSIVCILLFLTQVPSLCYKKNNNTEFTMSMWLTKLKPITKCSIQWHNRCSHLPPASSHFFFCCLHLAEVLQYHIIKVSILGFNYTHVSMTHFNTLFLMNRGEIEEQYLHPWVSMSL